MKDKTTEEFFQERQKFSKKKIEKIINFYKNKQSVEIESASIYLTGSYGRGEAKEDSDVDLFFLGTENKPKVHTYLQHTSFEMIKNLKFPDFTDDGVFLKLHTLEEVTKNIGNQNDDFNNHFTARMLLLLESQCIYNEPLYKECVDKILGVYFRDLDENNKNEFRPIFLLNDILRYWRTICLNYEFKRSDYLNKNSDDPESKAKQKLKNKKLKFNRIWLCYSFIIPLIEKSSWTLESTQQILKLSPYERLKSVTSSKEWDAESEFSQLADNYRKFQESISNNENMLSLKDPNHGIWKELNAYATEFRIQLIKIIEKCPSKEMRSYLYI